MSEQYFTVEQLARALADAQEIGVGDFSVILCADEVAGPSPWADSFSIEVDRDNRVIRLKTEVMA